MKMIFLFVLYLFIGLIVANIHYMIAKRDATSALEGVFAVLLWPLIIINYVINVMKGEKL